MSDPLPGPEGNRGATPTWDPSFSYRRLVTLNERVKKPVGEGELRVDRSIGQILRPQQKSVNETPRKMADNRRKQRDLSATVSIWGLARRRGRISARNFSRFLPIIRSDMKMRPLRPFITAGLAATLVCLAVPASAQYTPKPLKDPTTGESFHIEVSADIWRPNASISVQSEGLGIVGNEIDLKRDLGVVDKQMSALDLVLRPAPRHKFRFQYLPIKYEAASILNRDVVFNGIRYRANLPVNTLFDWK